MERAWFRKERINAKEPAPEGDGDLECVLFEDRPRNLSGNTAFIDSIDTVTPIFPDEFADKVVSAIQARAQERLDRQQ